jgi:MFS family permease
MAVLVYGYFSLLPVVVGETMGTDTRSQGLAMAAGGFGVAVGAVTMGPLSRRIGVGRVMVIAVLGSGLGLAGLGIAHTALVVLIAVTFLPTFTNVQNASANVLLQTMAPPGLRGRVVGLYSMVFSGLLPVGTITVGWLGERFGVRETLFALAGGMVLLTLALIKRLPTLRADASAVGSAAAAPVPAVAAPSAAPASAATSVSPATPGEPAP